MSALELGFLISFVTWVFPLLSLGLFSYGLALHSKRSTGAVHFFFAAFAAFCRNLMFLIDYGTRSPLGGHEIRQLFDLILLLAMALSVIGSLSFLSAQGIKTSQSRRRVMITASFAAWAIPAMSGMLGSFTAIEVLHHAIYNSAVVGLAWVYLVLGAVAARHFGKSGQKAEKWAISAAVLILVHPVVRMYLFQNMMVPRAALWWWLDIFLLGASTTLAGMVVIFIAKSARVRGLNLLVRKQFRATKILSKRSFAIIGAAVIIAVLMSLLLIQRSGEELTSAVAKQLQSRQLSNVLNAGSHLQAATKTLASCLAGVSELCSSGLEHWDDGVFHNLVAMANDQLPCNLLITDTEGRILKTDARQETARRMLGYLAAAPFDNADAEKKVQVAGPVFIGPRGSPAGFLVFYAPLFAQVASGQVVLYRTYLFASAKDVTSTFLKGAGSDLGPTILADDRGQVLLSTEVNTSAHFNSYRVSDSPADSAMCLLSRMKAHSPDSTILKSGDSSELASYCSVRLGGLTYYLVATAPWDVVLSSIDEAYLKQYQLLGFIVVLVLLGSGIALEVSTRWGVALERMMLVKTEQLHQEKVNLEQTMRSIGNPLLAVDEELNITYANPEFASAFGSPDGRKCYQLVFGRSEPCEDCLAKKAIESDHVCHSVRQREDDVQMRIFDITASPKRDIEGNVLESILLLNDITERSTLQRKVKESEEKYKRLVEASPDMVCIVQSRRLIYANQVLMRKLGFAPSELFSNDFDIVTRVVHPDWRAKAVESLERLENEGAELETELSLVTAGGQELRVLFKGVPITYSGQDAVELILVDITKLNELHKQLLQAERLASLGELTASIAHELNNKLAPILAYSEMLQDRVTDDAVSKRLMFIENCAVGAKSVVESLLAFPRTGASVRKSVNLNKILEDTVQLVKYRLDAFNIDLILELDKDLPRTMADRKQMEQVFLNIINNAYQAMEDRGGTLYIQSSVEGDNIVFQITDTGPGIPEANLARIFEPFFTTKPVGKGTGLGLPCSYGIVKAHNGDLRCASKVLRGTTFTIQLPIVEGEPEEEAPEKTQVVSQEVQRGANILVVDDEEILRGMVYEILAPDHTVLLASNGQEAIDTLKRETVDMIITDLRMPGLDGFALFKWVKKNRPGLEKRILFTTGDIYEPKTREFIRQVEFRCISKPFSVDAFVQQVSSLLVEQPAAPV